MAVYFVECNGKVKIGYSDKPMSRLGHLQTGNPEKITLVGVVEDFGRDEEKLLHSMFRAQHYRGEWYKYTGEVEKIINRIAIKNNIDKEYNEIKNLQESVAKLESENDDLKKRVSRLEGTDRDLRIKAERVLGFTMSNVNGYYNAVRTINGGQVRIYIGKKTDMAEEKIITHLLDNASRLKGEIKSCDDLMAIEKLAEAVKKSDYDAEYQSRLWR